MPQDSDCKSSKFVDVLRHYGPITRNDSMYDERVQEMHRKKGIQSFEFPSYYIEEIVANFKQEQPQSVILTGTAGDGKTYYCRQTWNALGGDSLIWSREEKINTLNLGSKTLVVVKDLSEVQDEQKGDILSRLNDSLYENESNEVFLIAGNDGQLIDALSHPSISTKVAKLKLLVEDLLVDEVSRSADVSLKLFNLSRIQTASTFPAILGQVLNHPAWNDCVDCSFGGAAIGAKVCPIFENRRRLMVDDGNNITIERLIELLRLCDLDGLHLPIRQQLLLIANMLLGHSYAGDGLLKCKEIPKIVESGKVSAGSLYGNVFGENLPERRRESIDVFQTLRRFGIGNETSNKIDNMLIFGTDDTSVVAQFDELVRADSVYGADQNYLTKQSAYLEAEDLESRVEFLDLLRRQRQRLFFVTPSNMVTSLSLWELSLYHDAGNYLNLVYGSLVAGQPVSKQIINKLVKGLNRIFTGMMANNQQDLVLASSGHYSQARVCRVFEDKISAVPRRGEYVSVELDKRAHKPILKVSITSSSAIEPAVFELSLTRFEYLCRVADGALPTSFSQECYEDILSFKTKILRQLVNRRMQEESQAEDPDRMELCLLDVGEDGNVIEKRLEVVFCS
ncbi:MAG: hypothetical protein IPJ49_03740 [Candidatus Obscuribacter sp.]|jgi:hypothetical protein|nr:hypothetical protein [Candidatus Obscuribacter sp.]